MSYPIFKLIDRERELENNDHLLLNKPAPGIAKISIHGLEVKNNVSSLRFQFIIPWIIGLSIVIYLFANEFRQDWKKTEYGLLLYVKSVEKTEGQNYFETGATPSEKEMYLLVKEGKMPLETYINHRYKGGLSENTTYQADVALITFLVIAFMILIPYIIGFKRRANLYFDREKKLVYTWRSGKVWAQRYEHLDYWSNLQAIQIRLRRFEKKGNLNWCRFAVQPTGNLFYNGGDPVYNILFSFIIKYMKHGHQEVYPENWQAKKSFHFFEDKKPQDFDAQLEKIVLAIDNGEHHRGH